LSESASITGDKADLPPKCDLRYCKVYSGWKKKQEKPHKSCSWPWC